jgi:hypothetical protein
MLKSALNVIYKLAASLVAIAAFFFISAQLPYFQSDQPISLAGFTPMSGNNTAANLPATLSITDGDARFSGDFFDAGSNTGFAMEEVDVAGPCTEAGERYLAHSCPQCSVTPAISDAGDPPTLFWMDPTAEQSTVGTIFRDCAAELPNGQVRVPVLSFSDNNIDLTRSGDDSTTAPIPALANSTRESHMTLGNWAITVDSVDAGVQALDQMGLLLGDAGWQEVSQGKDKPRSSQRVYARGEAHLCVVTLNQIDGAFQLVTMMNI